MKKRVIAAALCAAALLLAACAKGGTELRLAETAETNAGLSTLPLEITLEIGRYDGKNGILTVVLDNHSGYEMDYTDVFTLEQRQADGSFAALAPKTEREVTSGRIADLQRLEFSLDLKNGYGVTEPGTYRVSADGLSAEFELVKQ